MLGMSEEEVEKNYTYDELFERNMFESWNGYVERELIKQSGK